MCINKREELEEKKFLKNLREESYEEFVAGYYKLDGYSIYLNKKDDYKGIDIICMKDDILILIQCINLEDNRKDKITNESLKIFLDSSNQYINKNNLFNKTIKLKYIASTDSLDELSFKLLKENEILDYEILEMKLKFSRS